MSRVQILQRLLELRGQGVSKKERIDIVLSEIDTAVEDEDKGMIGAFDDLDDDVDSGVTPNTNERNT